MPTMGAPAYGWRKGQRERLEPPVPPSTIISHGGRAYGGFEHPSDQQCPLCRSPLLRVLSLFGYRPAN